MKQAASSDPYTVSTETTDPAVRMRPRDRVSGTQPDATGQPAKSPEAESSTPAVRTSQEVLWEVGSVSDDEEEPEQKGIGGVRSSGERGGLLLNNDEDDEDDGRATDSATRAWRSQPGVAEDAREDEEDFGEYKAATGSNK